MINKPKNELNEFLKKHDITPYRFSKITGFGESRLGYIVRSERPVPAYMKYLLELMEFKHRKTGEY